jgi:hypothetical protein
MIYEIEGTSDWGSFPMPRPSEHFEHKLYGKV